MRLRTHRGLYREVRSTTVSKSACSKQALGGFILPCACMLKHGIVTYWRQVTIVEKETDGGHKYSGDQGWNPYSRKTTRCESGFAHGVSVDQERESRDRRWLDTVVVLTVNYTAKSLGIWHHYWSPQNLRETESFRVLGEVWSQGWNLKELTERHHQEWSLRLNSTQHGETHEGKMWIGLTS